MTAAEDGTARFAQGAAGDNDCVLPLLRLLLANGVPAQRMALIRWGRLSPLLGARWPDAAPGIFALVRTQARAVLGADAICLRFDDASAVIVLHDGGPGMAALAPVDAVAAAVRRMLFGALDGEDLVEVWAVQSADQDGLACRRDGRQDVAPATPAAAPAHHQVVLTDTDYSYLPLWEVRRNSVFFYACEPFWTLPGGSVAHEHALAGQLDVPAHAAALDCEVVSNVGDVLADVMDHDRMAQVLVPVHYSTLADETLAARYFGEAAPVGYELAERAYMEIVGVPADVDAARLRRMAESLRPVCRDVCVRVDGETQALEAMVEAGIFAVGLTLRGERRDEAEVMAALTTFAERVAAVKLRSYAYGVASTSLGVAAVCSGVDFLGTDGLSATLEGCVLDDYPVRPVDLYQRIFRTVA